MNRNNAHFFILLLTALSFSACSGVKMPGGGGGTGSISVMMVADTLPPHPSLLSLQVTITGITLTTSSNIQNSATLSAPITVDLMRLQSDTAFLGTFLNIPTASYKSATLAFSSPAEITFLNDTASTLSGCAPNTVCTLASNTAAGTPIANVTFAVIDKGLTGIGIDLNLNNAVSITGTTLAVNLSNNNVISAFTLPRQGSNLSASQFGLIEDFTGVVSLTGNSVTITSPTRGTLTASATSNTVFDSDPANTLCPSGTSTLSGCVSLNQVASVDAVLNDNGTLSIQEIEPLLSTRQDIVEGIVTSINSTNLTQFGIIVTDKPSTAASNSLIGGLNIGNLLTVNIPAPNPFLVDTKGLPMNTVSPGSLSFFANQTNTAAIHLGQTVALHVTSFTPAAGTTPASSVAATVILRWSRFTATPVSSTLTLLNVTGLPSYFNFTPAAQLVTDLFPGTRGTKGVTNFDGIVDGTGISSLKPVALRALFLENPGSTANPALFAASVRQH